MHIKTNSQKYLRGVKRIENSRVNSIEREKSIIVDYYRCLNNISIGNVDINTVLKLF